jgi:radical SAM protein with 4Fe4S-binding SPASM domain
VQKANHRHLSETVTAALQLGFDSLSFLAADVSSEAFNRPLLWPIARQDSIALTPDEVDALDGELDRLIAAHWAQFETGFLQESPVKLRGIVRAFRVHLGQLPARAPLCNAPWVAAVLEPNGDVRPCFFHPPYGNVQHATLQSVVTGAAARRLRDSLDVSAHPTCKRCVCSLNYRGDVSPGPSNQFGSNSQHSSTLAASK